MWVAALSLSHRVLEGEADRQLGAPRPVHRAEVPSGLTVVP
jgi:hypothetical protein